MAGSCWECAANRVEKRRRQVVKVSYDLLALSVCRPILIVQQTHAKRIKPIPPYRYRLFSHSYLRQMLIARFHISAKCLFQGHTRRIQRFLEGMQAASTKTERVHLRGCEESVGEKK